MHEIKRYQVRGIPGEVIRADFDGRIVDYWQPRGGSEHLLIAHDGQNVFDGRTSTHRGQTWKMAHSALRTSQRLGIKPPTIVAIWHSSTASNPWGRAKDLTPQKYFGAGEYINPRWNVPDLSLDLDAHGYLEKIFSEIIPTVAPAIPSAQTAMIGSSMGGLATLYALSLHPEKFATALSLSPHWILSDEKFVEKMIAAIPDPGSHKVWMSIGTKGLDSDYLPLQRFADQEMAKKGYGRHDYLSKVYKRSGHNERSWARYLDEPMSFWLTS